MDTVEDSRSSGGHILPIFPNLKRSLVESISMRRPVRLRTCLAIAVVLGVAWLLYDPCYCWLEGGNSRLHLRSLPAGCEVLTFPEWWTTPEGEYVSIRTPLNFKTGEIFANFEFRRPPNSADEIFVALRSRAWAEDYEPLKPRNTKQKYAFRFPALAGHPESPIRDFGPISDEKWSTGVSMPVVRDDPELERIFGDSQAQNLPLQYKGRTFPKTGEFYWLFPALPSVGQRRIALLSYGNRRLRGNAVLDPDWLARPWRSYAVDVYDVKSGAPIRQLRAWGCGGGEFNDIQWHGDQILALPLGDEAEQVLLCGVQ